MSYPVTVTQSQVLTALRSALLTALPLGVAVVQGQSNRVPEPAESDFVVMTPILRARLETNVDSYLDVKFTGSVAALALTVSAVTFGTIRPGVSTMLYGPGVTAGTRITSQTSGTTGGIGVYAVSASQSITSRPLAAGVVDLMQPTSITVQCDVHGPASPDNVQIISTLMRSSVLADIFTAGGSGVQALYASDPRETPFINAEQQYEMQWSVDVVLQANQAVRVPQEFMDEAIVVIETPPDM